MQTVANKLEASADKLKELLEILLLSHSSIYLWNTPDDVVTRVSAAGNYAYRKLGDEGRQLQSQLLNEYTHFFDLLSNLLQGQPQDTLRELSQTETIIRRTIEQQRTWCNTTQDALDKVIEALHKQVGLLNRLYDASSGEIVYVPD